MPLSPSLTKLWTWPSASALTPNIPTRWSVAPAPCLMAWARPFAWPCSVKEAEARAAGADIAGAEELVAKIKEGWLEFDAAVATPDVMALVGQVGRVLGPRGLMPNAKTGTVTFDVATAVKELKAGRRQGWRAPRPPRQGFLRS